MSEPETNIEFSLVHLANGLVPRVRINSIDSLPKAIVVIGFTLAFVWLVKG